MNVNAAPTNVALAGYDRLRSRTFLILKDGNQAFDDLVQAIRTHGLNGGAKGYFTAWGASEDGEELDIRRALHGASEDVSSIRRAATVSSDFSLIGLEPRPDFVTTR